MASMLPGSSTITNNRPLDGINRFPLESLHLYRTKKAVINGCEQKLFFGAYSKA
jgi:hypothetical protein